MKKCLIMLTSGFPYGVSEPFLEAELPHHADNFYRVIIFALDSGNSSDSARSVPPCVETHNISPHLKKISRLADISRAAAGCLCSSEHYTAERERIGKSLKKRAFLEYFYARSQRHLRELLPIADSCDFSEFDEIVIYSYWFFVTANTAILLRNHLLKSVKCPVRLVSRGHGYDIHEYANALGYLPGREAMLSEFDRLYVCSEYGRDYLCNIYPHWSDKIVCSHLGSPPCNFRPAKSDDVFRIVSCSRVVPLKRLELIVDALALLDSSGLKLSWTHIGDGHELKTIVSLAEKKLSNIPASFVGSMDNSSVLELYQRSRFDIIVNVSSTEGLPVSIMEAFSCGIPAIATNVGGTSEIVRDGVTGFLLPRNFSVDSLSELIRRLAIGEISSLGEMSDNAFRCWSESFCADKNYENFSREIFGIQGER